MTLPIVETASGQGVVAQRRRWPGVIVALVIIAAVAAAWNRLACRVAGSCP